VSIADNLRQVQRDIADCAAQCGRSASDVRLLAVSKTKPLTDLESAYAAGQRLFGENYVQEAVEKYQALSHLSDIEWHFIGPIQSNKSRQIAETMDWVHTIDREKIARRLSEQRPTELAPLNVLIQVNISGEASKSGIELGDLEGVVALVKSLPNLSLRGLMAIPAPQTGHSVMGRSPSRFWGRFSCSVRCRVEDFKPVFDGIVAGRPSNWFLTAKNVLDEIV